MNAVRGNKLEICKLLNERGADVNKIIDGNNSLLICAIVDGNYEMCKWLIEKGADVNYDDNFGFSILMRAIPNYNLCSLLIKNGADVNFINKKGYTPLLHAIDCCDCKICEKIFINTMEENICKIQHHMIHTVV